MATISLNLEDTSLCINSSDELDIAISSDSGNTLTISDNGVYAPAPKGTNGSTGTGYTGPYATNVCTNVGCVSPFETTASSNKYSIKCALIVHRTWTYDGKDDNDIVKLKGFRSNVDYVMPGDIIKNGNSYYVITQVSSDTGSLGNYSINPGNHVVSYVKM